MKTENAYNTLEQQTDSGFILTTDCQREAFTILDRPPLILKKGKITALFLRKIKRTFYKNKIYQMLQSC